MPPIGKRVNFESIKNLQWLFFLFLPEILKNFLHNKLAGYWTACWSIIWAYFIFMIEQLTLAELQQQVDHIKLGLLELQAVPGIISVAFYAMPPWTTRRSPDLDLLVVADEQTIEAAKDPLRQRLTNLSSERLPIDAWVLTPTKLEQRMRRIAGVTPKLPPIYRSLPEWKGFGFVPVLGDDYLTKTIQACYENPEPGGPIPPDPSEHILFSS
jgi:hypothetical protein